MGSILAEATKNGSGYLTTGGGFSKMRKGFLQAFFFVTIATPFLPLSKL